MSNATVIQLLLLFTVNPSFYKNKTTEHCKEKKKQPKQKQNITVQL
jgi:hypothetical protein